jgi:ribonuclease HII
VKSPNLLEEKKCWKNGFNVVVGLDEVGRGPLAGPVVAGAVFLPKNFAVIKGITDSKKLSEKQREKFYNILINNKNIKWGIGIVSEKVIDKINILQATKLAMKKAIKNLQADYLLLDGSFKLDVPLPQTSIIKGDSKVFSISCASIIAKVTRDRLMQKYHKKYSQYGFDKHKGYGTALHIKQIKKLGACPIHRKSFYPVSEI